MSKLEALLARIPYLAPHGLQAALAADGSVTVHQPFRPALANYVGIVHAGAIYTLAETAAGIVANELVSDLGGFILLSGASVRYTRRVEGDADATGRVDPAQAAAARARFESEGRAEIAVEVIVTAADGETAFAGSFDYALRRRKQ
jgi:acyl-coenzyme A thioesterase PaaI-like protein